MKTIFVFDEPSETYVRMSVVIKMKKAILYLLVFTYSTVMFQPVMPYAKDTVAHLFFFHDHMNTVHAHNGKSHVHTEIAETAKQQQQENTGTSLKKATSGNEHNTNQPVTETSFFGPLSDHISFAAIINSNVFIIHDFPPPRA